MSVKNKHARKRASPEGDGGKDFPNGETPLLIFYIRLFRRSPAVPLSVRVAGAWWARTRSGAWA